MAIACAALIAAAATDPTATDYPWADCQGSAKPYPAPDHAAGYPDTLKPVMINHVGRHGARYPSSPKKCNLLLGALRQAESQGTITATGRKLMALTQRVVTTVDGRWGALDTLGMAEQRGIASRMIAAYPELFKQSTVNAISSYSPRCIMSMDEFTHQLARMDNSVELDMASGRRFSSLVRFFDNNAAYAEFRRSDPLRETYDAYLKANCPTVQLKRVLGDKFDFEAAGLSPADVALAEYSVLAGLAAMGLEADVTPYLNKAEQNALWAIDNLAHYLQRSASTISSTPADIAAPLLEDLIATTDGFVSGNRSVAKVNLRFGHAETLMPLLALMHLQGCYYLTNYFDTVAMHWRDFDVVPMGANLQLILFVSESGRYYLRVDHNEVPVALMPNETSVYTPWTVARNYLQRCLPAL